MSDTDLCATCREPLAGSPSDYFCTPVCQQTWESRRATPLDQPDRMRLVGYPGSYG